MNAKKQLKEYRKIYKKYCAKKGIVFEVKDSQKNIEKYLEYCEQEKNISFENYLEQEGIVVSYDKLKKKALPNRKNSFENVEEEKRNREDTFSKTSIMLRELLPSLIKKFKNINDPRNQFKIKHKITSLLIYGIVLFLFNIGSRREGNRKIPRNTFYENLKKMFPELESMPHGDTLARLLARMEDVKEIQECFLELFKELRSKKKFKNYLTGKAFLIAVDGSQKFYREHQWSKNCLQRKIGKEKQIEQHYVYALEAVIVLSNGVVLPLYTHFLENKDYVEGETKQDCESKAFKELAKKLQELFRRWLVKIVLDGLYACGPLIKICRKNTWDYMIVLKEDALKSVWKEAQGLINIDPDNSLKVIWGNRNQKYQWANEIEYVYGENGRQKEILNVVICTETWTEEHPRINKNAEEKTVRYAWLSAKPITPQNVFLRCTKIARYRWKIENNFLIEKHQGYHFEHCFSYTWEVMEGFHYLMKIGHFINQIILNSELLNDLVLELGIRGFISNLRDMLAGYVFEKSFIDINVEKNKHWRLIL